MQINTSIYLLVQPKSSFSIELTKIARFTILILPFHAPEIQPLRYMSHHGD